MYHFISRLYFTFIYEHSSGNFQLQINLGCCKKIISLKKEVVILPLFANASVAEKNCIVIVQVSLDNLYGGSQIAVVYGLERWK